LAAVLASIGCGVSINVAEAILSSPEEVTA
jgi:hypothetical protein